MLVGADLAADQAAQLDPGAPRQVHVEQDQVEDFGAGQQQGLLGIFGQVDPMAVTCKQPAGHVAVEGNVFDHQHAQWRRDRADRRQPPAAPGRSQG
ncbi:hypothetical protein D3C78_1738230 [compost metagenome]